MPSYQAKENLKKIFGFDEYKNSQQEIIKEVVKGKDILTVMPTGGGKSLCYQLPATLFNGLTLVVSPHSFNAITSSSITIIRH